MAPERSPLGCWEMCVKATRDVAAGQELLLCYREGPSDDFFLHYGFVPPLCNPHEVRQRCCARPPTFLAACLPA